MRIKQLIARGISCLEATATFDFDHFTALVGDDGSPAKYGVIVAIHFILNRDYATTLFNDHDIDPDGFVQLCIMLEQADIDELGPLSAELRLTRFFNTKRIDRIYFDNSNRRMMHLRKFQDSWLGRKLFALPETDYDQENNWAIDIDVKRTLFNTLNVKDLQGFLGASCRNEFDYEAAREMWQELKAEYEQKVLQNAINDPFFSLQDKFKQHAVDFANDCIGRWKFMHMHCSFRKEQLRETIGIVEAKHDMAAEKQVPLDDFLMIGQAEAICGIVDDAVLAMKSVCDEHENTMKNLHTGLLCVELVDVRKQLNHLNADDKVRFREEYKSLCQKRITYLEQKYVAMTRKQSEIDEIRKNLSRQMAEQEILVVDNMKLRQQQLTHVLERLQTLERTLRKSVTMTVEVSLKLQNIVDNLIDACVGFQIFDVPALNGIEKLYRHFMMSTDAADKKVPQMVLDLLLASQSFLHNNDGPLILAALEDILHVFLVESEERADKIRQLFKQDNGCSISLVPKPSLTATKASLCDNREDLGDNTYSNLYDVLNDSGLAIIRPYLVKYLILFDRSVVGDGRELADRTGKTVICLTTGTWYTVSGAQHELSMSAIADIDVQEFHEIYTKHQSEFNQKLTELKRLEGEVRTAEQLRCTLEAEMDQIIDYLNLNNVRLHHLEGIFGFASHFADFLPNLLYLKLKTIETRQELWSSRKLLDKFEEIDNIDIQYHEKYMDNDQLIAEARPVNIEQTTKQFTHELKHVVKKIIDKMNDETEPCPSVLTDCLLDHWKAVKGIMEEQIPGLGELTEYALGEHSSWINALAIYTDKDAEYPDRLLVEMNRIIMLFNQCIEGADVVLDIIGFCLLYTPSTVVTFIQRALASLDESLVKFVPNVYLFEAHLDNGQNSIQIYSHDQRIQMNWNFIFWDDEKMVMKLVFADRMDNMPLEIDDGMMSSYLIAYLMYVTSNQALNCDIILFTKPMHKFLNDDDLVKNLIDHLSNEKQVIYVHNSLFLTMQFIRRPRVISMEGVRLSRPLHRPSIIAVIDL